MESGGTYLINYNDKYYVHIFLMDYDENLPIYFANNHNYIWNKMNKSYYQTKIFEKRKLEWFTKKKKRKKIENFMLIY